MKSKADFQNSSKMSLVCLSQEVYHHALLLFNTNLILKVKFLDLPLNFQNFFLCKSLNSVNVQYFHYFFFS